MPHDPFDTTIDNPLLREAILARIAEHGPITFRDFMEMALYHPRLGYYASHREPIGRRGDYVTSPEVHPLFGFLVAKQLRQMWDLMGEPARFDAVEMGAGRGLLARDILRWASTRAPEFARALRYRIVERSEAMRDRQRDALAELDLPPDAVTWCDMPEAASIEGCILSNELPDSFPVHRVAVERGELLEVYVAHRDGAFVEELAAPSTPEIARHFERLGLLPGEGCHAEVNLAALDWMAQVARALRRGFVLTFDYGYPAVELYAPWRKDGTLLCFYRHTPNADPYARIGRQDMTAHIDFTSLMRVGEEHGLRALGLTAQAEILSALGIEDALGAVRGEPGALEEYYARRRAIQELTDPAGLGRINVLVQAKALDEIPELDGLKPSY